MPRNPDYAAHVRHIFERATFVPYLGMRLDTVGEGVCDTSIEIEPRHGQQNGYVHTGVIATLADHSAGCASATLVAADQGVLTVEFKLTLLRPSRGNKLRCRAVVLKAGKTLSFAEAEVFSLEESGEVLAAKASVTLAVVAWS